MAALSNARHERFAQEVAKGHSATEAYEAAGYKPHRQAASRLLANVDVQQRVEELQEGGANRAEITIQRTLEEIGRIGFSDLRQAFDSNGNLLRPEAWPDGLAAAISSVEVTTKSLGEGEVEHIHKLRLWDKNAALEKIAKHLGMFVERIDHTVHTVTNEPMSPEGWEKQYASND